MADLFFTFDVYDYFIYLVCLDIFFTRIGETHPDSKELLQKGRISAACSLLSGTVSAVSKTI